MDILSKIDESKVIKILDHCYDKALLGLPGTDSAEKISQEYIKGRGTLDEKTERLIRWQIAKCATTGFVTGLGGVIVLPFSISADLFANYYVLLRMIAAIAMMHGYDPRTDRVRTLAY